MFTVASDVPAHPLAVSASNVTVAVIKPVDALYQVWVGVASFDAVPSPKFQVKFCAPANSGMVNSNGEHTESVPRFKVYSVAAYTFTVWVATSVHPNAWVAVNVTSYAVSASMLSKVWLADAPASVVPSPNDQLNDCAFTLVLAKLLVRGSQPSNASALKLAVGWGLTEIKSTAIPLQPCSVSPVTVTM